MDTHAAADDSVVRVFISSTFHDFQEERDVLVKRVFPELRRTLNERGLDVVEVDLRWGITAEQSERGETIPICITEIDRCRPYFIAMLGDRYGWIPPEAALAALDRDFPHADRTRGVSVTELEIRHGLFGGDTAKKMRALFYLRAPRPSVRAESPEAAQKLEALKGRIRSSGAAVVDGYSGLEAFAERVRSDLLALIGQDYSIDQMLGEAERVAAQHAAYARRLSQVHVGRRDELAKLDAWLAGDAQPLLLVGEPGIGKSELLATWCARRAAAGDEVFQHYVGAEPASYRHEGLLERLRESVRKSTGVDIRRAGAPVEQFAACFAAASAYCETTGRNWIVAIDGLDQMSSGAAELLWLPTTIPAHVHLLGTSADDPAAFKEGAFNRILAGLTRIELAARGETDDDEEIFSLAHSRVAATQAWRVRRWGELALEGLGADDQLALIASATARFHKSLSSAHVSRIQRQKLAAIPLFLSTLLDELRVFGTHSLLEQRLEYYLAAQSLTNLFDRVLERLEKDCAPGVAAPALQLLCCSRAGLEEVDLVRVLGAAPLQWSPFLIQAGGLIASTSGRLSVTSAAFREACKERYLGSPAAERQVRLTLAHNFRLETNAARAAEEAPWQLKQAEAWNELEKLLTDLRWFQAIVARGSAELLDLWLPLKGRGRDPETLLIAAWRARKGERHSPEDLKLGAELSAFLRFAGAFGDGALRLHEELVEASARRVGALAAETLERTKDLASLLLARGEYRSAAERLSQVYAVEHRTRGGGDTTTALTAGLLARVALAERDYATAEPLLKGAYDVLRSAHGETDADTLSAMVDLAKVEAERGNLKEAGRLRRTVMKKRMAALGPEHPSTLEARAIYLDTQIDRGDLIDAKYEARAVLEARERVLGLDHPLTLFSAVALALALVRLDDHDARQLLDYSRQKLEHVLGHEHPEALSALQRLAERMIIARQFEEGEALLRRLIAARRRVLGPVHLDTLESMTALMSIFLEQGRLAEAESEQRQIAEGAEKALGKGSPRARWERDRLDRIRQMRRDERK